MKILFALPGLHRFNRGAEIAFISIAKELVAIGETVTLIGSGMPLENASSSYRFVHAGCVSRRTFESYPTFPGLRNEFAYEDLTFMPSLLFRYHPAEYDVTLTCSFPFTNLVLRRPTFRAPRPPHVFVTQNGDWPAYARNSENRLFSCEGLVCTNPDYLQRNQDRWHCELIPNGVDCERFGLASPQRQEFSLPENRFVVLMVSALDATKRVDLGIEAVSQIPGAHLVVAGDGPLRDEIDALALKLIPGRFTRLMVKPERMPALYQSSDVFLHLSKVESFGNVFLEAMACERPIVGHDSPRTRWIVGPDEYLVSGDDPVLVAAQISCARNDCSSNKQARIRRAAEFSWSNVAQQYRTFLREIVSLQS
jgi:glycosyltransferase involved in cell wall biosynthesis